VGIVGKERWSPSHERGGDIYEKLTTVKRSRKINQGAWVDGVVARGLQGKGHEVEKNIVQVWGKKNPRENVYRWEAAKGKEKNDSPESEEGLDHGSLKKRQITIQRQEEGPIEVKTGR